MRVFAVIFTFFLVAGNFASSQSIEWLKYREGKNSIRPINSAIDKENAYYVITSEDSSLNGGIRNSKTHLTKFSEFGDTLHEIEFPFKANVLGINHNSDVYALTFVYGYDLDYEGYKLQNLDTMGRYVLVVLDSSLKFKDLHILIDSASHLYSLPISMDFFNDGSLLLSFTFFDSLKINNKIFHRNVNSGRRKVVARYNADSKTFLWFHQYEFLGGQSGNYVMHWETDITTDDNLARILIDAHAGLYRDGVNTPVTGKLGYNDIDLNGNIVNEWYWDIHKASYPTLSALKSGRVMLSMVINPLSYYRIGGGPPISTNFQRIDYLHQFSKSGNLDWVISTDTIGFTPSTLLGYMDLGGFREQNGFSYAYFHSIHFNSTFGGLSFPISMPGAAVRNNFLVRFDTLGNMISNIKLPFSWFGLYSFELDSYGNPICTGNYFDTLQILDSIIIGTPNYSHRNLYHVKLGDFYIHRGPVSYGPYCAGDSFEIPFRTVGTFNSGNEFIAELSDENGFFSGNQRELGRIKATQTDTIWAKLPKFSVESSPDYRIRIRSTSPSAQSFYRRDSLRLLVYSVDSANAGNDTLICSGQSLQLYTSGGSRWAWSPAISLDDSTLKRPVAQPKQSTTYRIIISDSSGCGDTDTDYVYIEVRKPLKVDSLTSDIDTACIGQEVNLSAYVSGGDSTSYAFLWKSEDDVINDSLQANLKVYSDTVFRFVLKDGCTVIPDSQEIEIKTHPPLFLIVTKDSLCFHDTVSFSANTSGGKITDHEVFWYVNGNLTANSFSYKQYSDSAIWVEAQLLDNCTLLSTKDSLEAFVYPKISYTISDTSGCSPFLFEPKMNKLNKVVYSQTWQIENLTDNSEDPSIELMQSGTYNWIVVLNTGYQCSDTLYGKEQIYIEEAPTAKFEIEDKWLDIEDPLVKLKNISAGYIAGQEWEASNGFYSQDFSPQIQFSDTGYYAIKLKVWSPLGCTNEFEDSIRIHDIYTISIPNAFTPNGDARNNVFEPVMTGYKQYKMSIVDRWGEVLFQSENQAWDGTYQGKAIPDGVYMYRIDIKTEKGNRYFYTGSVYVLH